MKKQLPTSRLLFNETTLNVHLIVGSIEHEKWITVTYENDLWKTFMNEFSGQELTDLLKQLKRKNRSLDAIKVAKKVFSMNLRDCKDLIDNLAK